MKKHPYLTRARVKEDVVRQRAVENRALIQAIQPNTDPNEFDFIPKNISRGGPRGINPSSTFGRGRGGTLGGGVGRIDRKNEHIIVDNEEEEEEDLVREGGGGRGRGRGRTFIPMGRGVDTTGRGRGIGLANINPPLLPFDEAFDYEVFDHGRDDPPPSSSSSSSSSSDDDDDAGGGGNDGGGNDGGGNIPNAINRKLIDIYKKSKNPKLTEAICMLDIKLDEKLSRLLDDRFTLKNNYNYFYNEERYVCPNEPSKHIDPFQVNLRTNNEMFDLITNLIQDNAFGRNQLIDNSPYVCTQNGNVRKIVDRFIRNNNQYSHKILILCNYHATLVESILMKFEISVRIEWKDRNKNFFFGYCLTKN